MKIIAVILLVVGLGLMGWAYTNVISLQSRPLWPLSLGRASKVSGGDVRPWASNEAALKEEAALRSRALRACVAMRGRVSRMGWLMMFGGLASVIACVGLLLLSRRAIRERTALQRPFKKGQTKR